jgi:hypothetical protein
MTLLEKCFRSISLWSKKTAYKGMIEVDRLDTKRYAIERIQELKATGDERWIKIAEVWIEFYDWTLTYKD